MSCDQPQQPPKPICVTRGEDRTLLVTVIDANKNPVPLTGAKAWFVVKNRTEDLNILIKKKDVTCSGGGDAQILVNQAATGSGVGQLQVFVTPPDTLPLDPTETYQAECWVQLSSGKRYRVLRRRPFEIEDVLNNDFT